MGTCEEIQKMNSSRENNDLQEKHECPGCGRLTRGTYAESGTKTALCEDCLDSQRWDEEGGARQDESDK